MDRIPIARRLNVREKTETRPVKISFDSLARVDGSARFGFGETTALASVSGPIEARLASELPSKATFEVLVRPLANVPATEAKSLAATIRSSLDPSLILTRNPRTLVQLVIQSVCPSRSAIWNDTLAAAMINAGSLAIVNASSIPMRGIVSAVAVGRASDGSFIVDPSDDDLATLQGGGCFAFLFADGIGLDQSDADCVWTSWKSRSGLYDEKELFKAKSLARDGARAIYKAMKQSIESVFRKEAQQEMTEEAKADDPDDKMII